MCSIVVLHRPGHAWPMLVAANRDEMSDRPWAEPGRHWPERPQVVAGIDLLAGGTWLGMNDGGLVAAILNRRHSLGPEAGKRSRGELVLEALAQQSVQDAVDVVARVDASAYRSFNMVVLDYRVAVWIRNRGRGELGAIESIPLPAGVSMITAYDRNDTGSARIRRYLPLFQSAAPPDPESGRWKDWEHLLASRAHDEEDGPLAGMNVVTESPFGTVSSSLLALPAPAFLPRRPIWRFAAGRPDEVPFETVPLLP
ncbi:MAG: NRDE family protein [Acidobacteriota bacterium]